ncbi:major histocompatibility complex class I-related gene protein-like isoform X1 [Cyprinodon tularosa]|uniref:major histocompatibility complex class I-related gene protein-like isoform X1 n=1 Tax=Cyprinodon tularosa TaxID=77115 RepID=UPI0018E26813|nr:major histocompatibility complex class I-related gene protein-like isoform X1 [Cyprinodon tularosa]
MRNLILLLMVVCVAHTARHSLKNFYTVSTGVSNFPEFVFLGVIDDTEFCYCNISKTIVEGKSDWFKEWLQNQDNFKSFQEMCFGQGAKDTKIALSDFMLDLNLHEGVHILQSFSGCEIDYYKNQSSSFTRVGFDGEDFLTLDMNSLAWIPQNNRAASIKHKWDLKTEWTKSIHYYYTIYCPILLSELLKVSKMSLQKTVLPTVSLLQKTPSSPVSCHATGFYPESAVMFWRRSEEEIHEGVEHRDILPNHDETFQMETVLDVSLIPLEDWGKYDCVFQLYGVSNDIITPLDKTIIKTNQKESISTAAPIAASLVFVVLIIIAVIIYIYFRKKDSHNSTELTASLNQET